MWFLREQPLPQSNPSSSQTEEVRYWLGGKDGGGRTIGRKCVDIRLKLSSVSRTHATVHVRASSFAKSSCGIVPSVEDSSAYGTFVKQPSRTPGAPDEHHQRLDKERAVELVHGSLLAFGAPSSWWRVAWCPIKVLPIALNPAQTTRLAEIVNMTGLATASGSPSTLKDITHVVTNVGNARSMRILRAIAEGKHVVTSAWTDALMNMVMAACKAASAAGVNIDLAAAATAIPPEAKFAPAFSEDDGNTYDAATLEAAFNIALERSALFKGITFVFEEEARRCQWNPVLSSCGAKTKNSAVGGARNSGKGVVYVRPRAEKSAPTPVSAKSCAESDVIRAILSAKADDIVSLSKGADVARLSVAEPPVADVATPAPSNDSDAETADIDGADPDLEGSRGKEVVSRKRPRPPVGKDAMLGDDAGKSTRAPYRKQVDGERNLEDEGGAEDDGSGDDEALNPREFFEVPTSSPVPPPKKPRAQDGGGSAVDVRVFKRKALPETQSRIGLVKVDPSDEAAGVVPAAFRNQTGNRSDSDDEDDEEEEDEKPRDRVRRLRAERQSSQSRSRRSRR